MVRLDLKYLKNFISDSDVEFFEEKLKNAHEKLHNPDDLSNGKGWLELPEKFSEDDILKIENAAREIRSKCDVFIVIGIGGSYLGAKAGIEFLKPKYLGFESPPEVVFAGNTMSSFEANKIIKICKNKDVCLNVISKSGSTLECALTFRILRNILENKYGKGEACKRIYCTTDPEKGLLKEMSIKNGYKTFDIPSSVGGRYSVLTAVGLLPLAVAGANIRGILNGAKSACEKYKDLSFENECYKYAVLRNALYNKGKAIELMAGYEPWLKFLFEWWRQLFGESEGKCRKGIFPSSVVFSTDLHSMGQFIQEGSKVLFETVITVKNDMQNVVIPHESENMDNLNYLSGKSLKFINDKAFEGTIAAHVDGGVPNIHIEIDDADEYNLGYIIYFFEKACAISAYILGVDPFNQPGVEAYKKNMFSLLGRQ